MIPQLNIADYAYPLTDERIAKYPLAERDASKLLRYQDGRVTEHIFRDIPDLLPETSSIASAIAAAAAVVISSADSAEICGRRRTLI